MDKFIDATQNRVSGKVKMKLQNGFFKVVGRKSEVFTLQTDIGDIFFRLVFDQNLAKGFIELWGMETVIANKLSKNLSKEERR